MRPSGSDSEVKYYVVLPLSCQFTSDNSDFVNGRRRLFLFGYRDGDSPPVLLVSLRLLVYRSKSNVGTVAWAVDPFPVTNRVIWTTVKTGL